MTIVKKLEKYLSYQAYQKSPYKSVKHSTYFPVYDKLFLPYVNKNITFVEIGVLGGGSLFMWRNFFGENARIIGIDINPEAKKWEEHGFEIYIGSQSDKDFWKNFKNKVDKIDILLDDGGHTFTQQIITFDSILDQINNNGLIVVEDVHTSYMAEFGGPSKYSFIEYSKNIVDGINYRFSSLSSKKFERKIWNINFYESIVVFEINQECSDITSVPTENNGIDLDTADLRYKDSQSVKTFIGLATKFKFLNKFVFFRVIKNYLLKYFIVFRNSFINRKLKSYFKYF